MNINLYIQSKYGVGCKCCVPYIPFLEIQYWKHGFFKRTADYDFYAENIAMQDNMSLGIRPTLINRLNRKYSKQNKVFYGFLWKLT